MIVNVEESRNKCVVLLKEADYQFKNKNYDEAEKLYLRICRIAENIFCKTSLKNDSAALIEYYMKIINFYQNANNNEFVQRWHQKLVGILQTSCENSFSPDAYHQLMEWYLRTINIMLDNEDYNAIIRISLKMHDKAKLLFLKTKTDDDIKYIIISRLYLANAYHKTNKPFKAYHYYYLSSKKLHKMYETTKDEGMKNDLINIYQCLYEISNRKLIKFIAKRWKIKILLLKGDKNV